MFKDYMQYCNITGLVRWKKSPSKNIKYGYTAGCIDKEGYCVIRFKRRNYFAHRIIWELFYGVEPDGIIDHINGVKHDNRIENLRLCFYNENQTNTRIGKTNKSGILGVSIFKNRGWVSQVGPAVCRDVLYTEDLFEACCHRKSGELRHGYHKNHGRR